MEARPQRNSEFVDERQLLSIPPNYGFTWQQLLSILLMQCPLPIQIEEQQWVNLHLRSLLSKIMLFSLVLTTL